MRYGDVSNATCATLAGLFRSEIASVESARRWTEQKTVAKKFAIGSGLLIAVLIGASLIAAFLWTVFGDHGRAIGRALAWCFDEVAWPVGKWTVIIATAPIWVPVRYLLWPALCLIGRSFRSVGLACWNVWPVRTVRSAFVSVFTGIASGIRRFAAATRQVLADTWHLLRAFASAKWERLCPFIEWN
ncbi:hypothetical protein HY634_02335 [Candidatus Uhrbacteria bacterium]|nr:hypothetical protein [Candidatus Uhrbacteria bacterium]